MRFREPSDPPRKDHSLISSDVPAQNPCPRTSEREMGIAVHPPLHRFCAARAGIRNSLGLRFAYLGRA